MIRANWSRVKQNGEINRLGKGRGRESVREAGIVKIFQTSIISIIIIIVGLGTVSVSTTLSLNLFF